MYKREPLGSVCDQETPHVEPSRDVAGNSWQNSRTRRNLCQRGVWVLRNREESGPRVSRQQRQGPGASGRLGERARELAARSDSQLAVRVAEMHLDRLRRHVQGLSDVAVRLPVGGEICDPSLARRQGSARAQPRRGGHRTTRRTQRPCIPAAEPRTRSPSRSREARPEQSPTPTRPLS